MNKKKVKIEGIKKTPFRSEFTFGKSWEVVDVIENVLEKLGFSRTRYPRLKSKISGPEPGPKEKISKFVDKVYDWGNEVYFVDAFLGTKKIILTIRTKKDRQKEISEAVFKFADFNEDIR